jgi:hypothetical protein
MQNYFKTKTKLVQYVNDQLEALKPGSVLTMTIVQDMYEDYSAITATGELWVDIDAMLEPSSSKLPSNISNESTQVI